MNTLGNIFRLTSFGESHGPALGGVIDGVPSGFKIDFDAINNELARRRPGQSNLVTQRKEGDEVEFLSGIFEGKTTGTSIGFIIRNANQKSKDYSHIKDSYRPSHADYTYQEKYGVRDYRGGGRSSARETVSRVVAGALAQQFLAAKGIEVLSYVDQVGEIRVEDPFELSRATIEANNVRCPEPNASQKMEEKIKEIKKEGNTIGGCVRTIVRGLPVGIGEPVFAKLNTELSKAVMSINAAKGISFGLGFDFNKYTGKTANDLFTKENGKISTTTNHSGGIQGGISNGMELDFRTVFKPVATIMRDQQSIDKQGNSVVVEGKGRHDPCVLPRAVPIVDAMTAMVLLDLMLLHQAKQW